METRDRIGLGASAGGLHAVKDVVERLPPDFPGAILIVIHLPREGGTLLDRILARTANLPCVLAEDGAKVEGGHVYVARPGLHLLVEDGALRLWAGPRENRHCPAIDPLFRSLAQAYGPRSAGVILSGTMNDGVSGLRAIGAAGGLTVVQDPDEALYPEMPQNALAYVRVDACLRAAGIAERLRQAAGEAAPPRPGPLPAWVAEENRLLLTSVAEPEELDRLGARSSLMCPECGGSLWELHGQTDPFGRGGETPGPPEPLRFRCHVGHAFTAETLAEGEAKDVEHALWTALRALEDRYHLYTRLLRQSRGRGLESLSGDLKAKARDAREGMASIRKLLERQPPGARLPPAGP